MAHQCQRPNWFLQQKAECPAKTELDRLVRSAFNLYEQCLHETVALSLSPQAKVLIDSSLNGDENAIEFSSLKADPGRVGLNSVLTEAEKLQFIRSIHLPLDVFQSISTKALKRYFQRICSESAWDVKQHPPEVKYSLFAIVLFFRQREIIDGLIELFIQIVHRLSVRAERKLVKELLKDFQKVHGKTTLLFRIAEAALLNPEDRVKDVVYPIAGENILQNLLNEFITSRFIKSFEHPTVTITTAWFRKYSMRWSFVPAILGIGRY